MKKKNLTVVACAFDSISLNSEFDLVMTFDNFLDQFKMVIDKHAQLKKAFRRKQNLLRKR